MLYWMPRLWSLVFFGCLTCQSNAKSATNHQPLPNLVNPTKELLPVSSRYRNGSEIYAEMVSLQKHFPEQVYIYSIGNSVQGRRLWVIAISEFAANRHVSGRPEVKMVANIHGDETVGRELLMNLVAHLLHSHDSDSTILMRSARIHFLISMNPDGFHAAVEGNCYSGIHGRGNAHDKDLNRNFPDQQMGLNVEQAHLEPETLAVMKWLKHYNFVLSGSLHGGALVANYPFDSYRGDTFMTSELFEFSKHSKQSSPKSSTSDLMKTNGWDDGYAAAPDDDVFVHLARSYADVHPDIKLGCTKKSNGIPWDRFPNGITNGFAWYSVSGGMQDYNYLYAGCMELTLEVSCCKFPPGHQLPSFWMKNQQPMVQYLLQVNLGVRGFIRDSTGNPVKVKLFIKGREEAPFHSTHLGEYWRVLLPGSYTLVIVHKKRRFLSVPVVVPANSGFSVYNVTLPLHRKGHHRTSHRFPNISHYLYPLPSQSPLADSQIGLSSADANSRTTTGSNVNVLSSNSAVSRAPTCACYSMPVVYLVIYHILQLL